MVDLYIINKLSHLIPELVPGDFLNASDLDSYDPAPELSSELCSELCSESCSEDSSEALINSPDSRIDFSSKAHQRRVEFHLARYRSDSLSPVEVSRSAEELLRLYKPYLHSWILFLTKIGGGDRKGPFALFLSNPRFRRIPGDLTSRHRLIVRSLRHETHDDIKGALCLAFLEACLKSENITYGVPYFLAPAIYALIRDPSVFGGRCAQLSDALSENITHHSTYAQTGGFSPVGSQADLVYASEIRGTEPVIGPCEFADLVQVYSRGDGLLGAILSEDWILGKTVGLGGEACFLALTSQEREILLRFYVVKQHHSQIAQSMGISPRHSRTLLARSRNKLAELQEVEEETLLS